MTQGLRPYNPGFAFGEQGPGPCTPPEGPSAPLDSLTKGVFDPSGLPFVWCIVGRSGAQQARRMTRRFGCILLPPYMSADMIRVGDPTFGIRSKT